MATTNKLPEGSTWEQFKLENVTQDTTVTITFAEDANNNDVPDKYEQITVSAIAGENGSVSPEKKIITSGEDVTLEITPKDGYAVDSITIGGTTYVNDPNFGKAIIDDASEIAEAINDPEVDTLEINAPITTAAETQIDKPMTINGNGNTVTQTAVGKTFTLTQDSEVSNLDIVSTADNTDWHSSYGLQFYTGQHSVSNVKLSGGNAGMIVNGATVNLAGDIDVSNNTFGGIEVSKGTAPGLSAGVLNIGESNIINETETYRKPTIWIDGNTDAEGIVNGADAFTVVEVQHGDTIQKQFYLNAANARPVVSGDTSYDTVADAIAAGVSEISLNDDIEENVSLAAGKIVTINGNGHTFKGTITLGSSMDGEQGELHVSDVIFDGGSTSSWAIYNQRQTVDAGKSSYLVELSNCVIKNFTKKGIYATEVDSFTLNGCTFENCATDEMNDPNTYGDYVVDLNLVGVKDVDVDIANCVFQNNGAQKASVKVTQRGGESDEGASDMPQGITATVNSFQVTGCTFSDNAAADIQIGSDNKSASTNPDAENTTGAFGQATISGNITEVTVSTPYDGETYTVSVGQTFSKTGSQEPVIS